MTQPFEYALLAGGSYDVTCQEFELTPGPQIRARNCPTNPDRGERLKERSANLVWREASE